MALRRGPLVKVHVIFGDCKSIITLKQGDRLAELHKGFLQTFLGELLQDASQVKVKFQRHNYAFNDYEDMTPDMILMGDTKIKAFIAKMKNEESKKTMVTQNGNWEQADHQRKVGTELL